MPAVDEGEGVRVQDGTVGGCEVWEGSEERGVRVEDVRGVEEWGCFEGGETAGGKDSWVEFGWFARSVWGVLGV